MPETPHGASGSLQHGCFECSPGRAVGSLWGDNALLMIDKNMIAQALRIYNRGSRWAKKQLCTIPYIAVCGSYSVRRGEGAYSPSSTASIRMPTMMMPMNRYCLRVSFSFRKIRDSSRDTTHTQDRMGAAMAPLPLMAYT